MKTPENDEELRQARIKAGTQFMAAYKGEPVTCDCGKVTGPSYKLYRCYYCGIFFCDRCAAEHFGMTREEHNREHHQEYMVHRDV